MARASFRHQFFLADGLPRFARLTRTSWSHQVDHLIHFGMSSRQMTFKLAFRESDDKARRNTDQKSLSGGLQRCV